MNDDAIYRVGETKRVAYIARAKTGTFEVDAVTFELYEEGNSTALVTASGGVDNSDPAATHEIYYNYTPTSGQVGDRIAHLFATVGTQVLGTRWEVTVLPKTSKFDPWVREITDWIQQSEVSESAAMLSYRNLMQAAVAAVRVFDQHRPQRLLVTKALTASDWTYTISTDFTSWEDGFSRVEEIEYPVDATVQSRSLLRFDDVVFDVPRDEWRFVNHTPSTGESAKIIYTARHSLSHTADTVPTNFRPAVACYAAGLALMMAANKAAGSEAGSAGADTVNFRSKQQEFSAQARALKEQGLKMWALPRTWAL